MRRGEIFGLKWDDVDWGRMLLHVHRSFVDGAIGSSYDGLVKTPSARPTTGLGGGLSLKTAIVLHYSR
jgi:integrase